MPLTDQLDRLARFEPVPYPVVSLYLNTQPNDRGRDQYQSFVRQEFKSRSQTYPQGSPDRDSLDKDMERITSYLENDLQPSANGVAIFACDAAGLFETVQLNAPIEQHWLYSATRHTSIRWRGWNPAIHAMRRSSPTPTARGSWSLPPANWSRRTR